MMRQSKASVVAMMIVSVACVLAQMPGMEPPAKPEQPTAKVVANARVEGIYPISHRPKLSRI